MLRLLRQSIFMIKFQHMLDLNFRNIPIEYKTFKFVYCPKNIANIVLKSFISYFVKESNIHSVKWLFWNLVNNYLFCMVTIRVSDPYSCILVGSGSGLNIKQILNRNELIFSCWPLTKVITKLEFSICWNFLSEIFIINEMKAVF